MLNDYHNKLVEKEIRGLLVKFHKGATIGETSRELMGIIKGIRYLDAKKVMYVLKGLEMDSVPMSKADMGVLKAKKEGFNEAVAENNFAIDLSLKAFKELEGDY